MVNPQPVEITLDQAFNEMDKYQTSFVRLWSYYNAYLLYTSPSPRD